MTSSEGSERASRTALGVLTGVCIATSEPDPGVRLLDPVAPKLLRWRDGRFAVGKVRALHRVARRALERAGPGAYGYIVARIHHMDRVLSEEVTLGLDSLAILGAGYDTRAYRLAEELTNQRVFEVDHPATSREKQARLTRARVPLPSNLSFVEVDFRHQNLLERLAEAGRDPSERTLFLLSGVSMFLPEEAVSELFYQIASQASSRSSLLFDYVYHDVLSDPSKYHGGREWLPLAAGVGERPLYGIDADAIGDVLDRHGLRLASSLGSADLTNRYLHRSNGTTVARPFGFCEIAHAFPAGPGVSRKLDQG